MKSLCNLLRLRCACLVRGAVLPLLLVAGLPVFAGEPVEDSEVADDGTIRVGLPTSTLQGMNPADLRLAMNRIFEVAWSGSLPFRSEFYQNSSKFYAAIAAGQIDLAPMLIEDYLNRPADCAVDPVLQGMTDELGGGTELILLARTGVDLEALTGKKLLVDTAQQLHEPWLELVLADAGLPERRNHFGVITDRTDTKEAVFQAFFGKADACVTSKQAFDTLAELNPQLRKRLKVLATSEPFSMHVLCIASNLEEGQRDIVIEGLRRIHQTAIGKQLLLLTRINRIDYCDSALIDAAREINERWQRLRDERKEEWLKQQKELAARSSEEIERDPQSEEEMK